MAKRMTREERQAVYARLSSPENLLYHVAHGRKVNSAAEYDGEGLVAIALRRAAQDVKAIRAAAAEFRTRSLSRPHDETADAA